MRALDERRRAFVIARVRGGQDATKAVRAAGYSNKTEGYERVQAHRLMHSEAVLKAIREESSKLLDGSVFIAINALVEVASSGEKDADRVKAAENILDRTGFLRSTQHHVTVKDERTEAELVEFIRVTATRHGLDPKLLLGRNEIEGEFTEVPVNEPA